MNEDLTDYWEKNIAYNLDWGNNNNYQDNLILADIQKWFRNKYGIHVQPQKTFHNKTYIVGKIPCEYRIEDEETKQFYGNPNSYGFVKGKFKTYEQALEAGLLQALKLIK